MLKPVNHPSDLMQLPDPDQFPGRMVVIWDGKCNFCGQQVKRLYGWDWTGRLSFISLHDPRVSQRYPQLSHEQLMEQMWVVTPQNDQYGGADAVRVLSRNMPSLWWLAPVLHLPFCMPLWRAAYRWVAKRRYKLAGKKCDSGTCSLHG